MNVQAYLAFNGNCQEALNFYSNLFDAKVVNTQSYENKEMDIPENYRQKLQHAELKGNNIHFMAYDAAPDTPINHGNQVHMSIDADSIDEAENLFSSLANEGKVHHDFKEREWGHFGRCTDKFGINWMVNCKN